MSLRKKIILWYISSVLVIFLSFSAFLGFLLKKTEEKSIELSLFTKAEELEDILEKLPQDQWNKAVFSFPLKVIQIVRLKGEKAKVIFSKPESFDSIVEALKVPLGKILANKEYIIKDLSIEGSRYAVVVMKITESKPYSLLVVATSKKGVDKMLAHFSFIVLSFVPLLIVVAIFVGINLVKVSLSPIKEVIHTAKNMTSDNLYRRIPEVRTGDEVEELIKTFNVMLEKLESSFAALKRFSSDVAHELKTPITALKSKVEFLIKEKKCAECRDELKKLIPAIDELVGLVDSFLFLSRLDSFNKAFLKGKISLDLVLLDIFESFHVKASNKGIDMVLESVDSVEVEGDRLLLSRAIYNIVDNAVKFTPPAGKIVLNLTKKEDHAELTISDTGIGIPEKDLNNIFSHLYQVDSSRSRRFQGTGLGLTIAKRILDLHGANIKVKSTPGKGTNFIIRFTIESYGEP